MKLFSYNEPFKEREREQLISKLFRFGFAIKKCLLFEIIV